MERIAVIGAGVSGLSVARLLKDRYSVKVFEKESVPGGLIRCRCVEGSLFHLCGGHVFNSKRKDVLDWFWAHFDRDAEFQKTERNSVIAMSDNKFVPYPIENHFYLFDEKTQQSIIQDLLKIASLKGEGPQSFADFLKCRFGSTLYELYFRPYNEKIWQRSLEDVPLGWLEGKLPMPSVEEIIFNNVNHIEEKTFVHSSFWYERNGGSQFIANRLAEGLDIEYDADIQNIVFNGKGWILAGEVFDKVVFCGNVKSLPVALEGLSLDNYKQFINGLEYHGTTAVFCEIDKNPYSWVYQPSGEHRSHRIICTGNFSSQNNAAGKMTATIEFTDEISVDDIQKSLSKMPFNPRYLTHHYSKYTYPVQSHNTREGMKALKLYLERYGFYLCGRFADWEYYNMDVAMGAAMDLCKTI